jgi:cytochrome P450
MLSMTSQGIPIVKLPLPRSPLPFEAAPKALEIIRQGPVLRAELPDGSSGWLVTGFAEVREVLTNPRFSRAKAVSSQRVQRGTDIAAAASLLAMDPPEHTRLRKLVASTFTARRMRLLRPQITDIVNELLGGLLAQPRPADLVRSFSLPLPIRVICQMLGVPASDQDKFHAWSDILMSDWSRDEEEIMAAMLGMAGYLADLIKVKREAPADDLITALIAARDDNDRLSEDELVQMCGILLLGGHETTANHINMSLLTLLAHPAELARLRNDPDLIPAAVEELLRYVLLGAGLPPPRMTTEEVTLGGVTIPAGETVWPGMTLANRDPSEFPDPDRLDLTREPGMHLGFGAGAHHCVGAQLARIELQEAFRGLLCGVPGIRLAVPASDLRYKEKMSINSLDELPVTWD